MPIKVTYSDSEGNPIDDPRVSAATAPLESDAPPITNDERQLWNSLRAEALLRGVREDDFVSPEPDRRDKAFGLLSDVGIAPSRLPAYTKDQLDKATEQVAKKGNLHEVSADPFHSMFGGKPALQTALQAQVPRLAYAQYVYQRGDHPAKDYGTDMDKFIADMNIAKHQHDDEYAGMDNPGGNNEVWSSPSVVNGQLVQPAGFVKPEAVATPAPATPDPRFPTRDEKTGAVTPAKVSPEYADSVLKENQHLDWVKRLYEPNTPTIQVKGEPYPSTHLMSDDGNGYVFPRIQRINGKLVDLGDNAEDYARDTKTGIQLPKEQGTWFADNGYKTAPGVLVGKEPAPVAADPRFPTRDPITGRVTPAKVQTTTEQSPDEEEPE